VHITARRGKENSGKEGKGTENLVELLKRYALVKNHEKRLKARKKLGKKDRISTGAVHSNIGRVERSKAGPNPSA